MDSIAIAGVAGTILFGLVLLLPEGELQQATATLLVTVAVALVVMSSARGDRLITSSALAAHPPAPRGRDAGCHSIATAVP